MTLLDRLERPLARFAIPSLIRYVAALNALVFILLTNDPKFETVLSLDRDLILQGQVWRLISWIFIPATTGFLWTLLYLMTMWWIGDLLESAWGTFRLNVYYFLGMALCVVSALIFGASGGNAFLNLTLFLALATIAPNLEILLLFVLPVKIKWVALVSLIGPLAFIVLGALPEKMMALLCLGNYLLFFGPQAVRNFRQSRKNVARRVQFEAASDNSPYLHRCEVCGITELTHPHTDFRVAADGNEYCPAHQPQAI